MGFSNREKLRSAELAGATLADWPRGKKLESWLIEKMLESLGSPETSVEETERPDFFFSIEVDNRIVRVGCETTSLYASDSDDTAGVGSSEARFWENWRSFADRLRIELSKSSDSTVQSIYGAIHFLRPDHEVLDQLNQETFIREIVQLLEESPSVDRIESFSSEKYPQLSSYVSHIWTADVIDRPILWWAAHLRTGRLLDPGLAIRRIVSRKAIAEKKYDWRESEMRWLVITAPGRGILDRFPSYNGLTSKLSDIQSGFSHVFLFAWGLNGWYVLQLAPHVKIIRDFEDVLIF